MTKHSRTTLLGLWTNGRNQGENDRNTGRTRRAQAPNADDTDKGDRAWYLGYKHGYEK
jgi:hypothetical protein